MPDRRSLDVILSDAAIADLIEIGNYIAKDNPRRADSFVAELRGKCASLGDNPLAWPVVSRRKDDPIRRRVHRRYLIFYRVRPAHIQIMRIVHAARDHGAWLADA